MKKITRKPAGKGGATDTCKGWQKRLGQFSEGLSILLSMILITVIVLFSVGVTTIVIDSTRQASNVKEGTTAYYAAEAGLEQALWINKKLADNDQAMGADTSGSGGTGSTVASVNFKIDGTTKNIQEKTVNGKYIIPFPWTGDAPWHGEGAVAGTGGCDSQKPPARLGSGDAKKFNFTYLDANGDPQTPTTPTEEQYHPCNWNKLEVGQKATIPLYGKGINGMQNFTSFTLRLRTPCAFGNEMCKVEANQRLELNCFDKGDGNIKCVSTDDLLKGEVVLTWQIDAKVKATGDIITMLPNQKVGAIGYLAADAQLYEGKINNASNSANSNYQVLSEAGIGVVGQNTAQFISSFLIDPSLEKPVLKISAVADLVGCYGTDGHGTDCIYSADAPISGNYQGVNRVPYIEYQVVLPSIAATFPPVSPNNIITAEGQSGPFVQSIQVKVPNDETGLEYVIQQ